MLIKDCIYRFIEIPDSLYKFVFSTEFQRLRQIKQLGLAYYAYPGAVHTRYEHCLGVMHLSGVVIDHLRKYIDISEREKLLVQMAGLYHDIGHIALSHLADTYLEETIKDHFLSHHENRSIFLLNKVNDRLKIFTQAEIEIISKMILGKYENEEKPYLFQLVANKKCGIDTDRLDYLQRDLYHTGMPSFQPDYIIKCMRLRNGNLIFQNKALHEIKFMYNARMRLLILVCKHNNVLYAEEFYRKGLKLYNLEKLIKNGEWIKFTDATLQVFLDSSHPELIQPLYELDKNKVEEFNLNVDKEENIKYVTDKEIEECIKAVEFV